MRHTWRMSFGWLYEMSTSVCMIKYFNPSQVSSDCIIPRNIGSLARLYMSKRYFVLILRKITSTKIITKPAICRYSKRLNFMPSWHPSPPCKIDLMSHSKIRRKYLLLLIKWAAAGCYWLRKTICGWTYINVAGSRKLRRGIAGNFLV